MNSVDFSTRKYTIVLCRLNAKAGGYLKVSHYGKNSFEKLPLHCLIFKEREVLND